MGERENHVTVENLVYICIIIPAVLYIYVIIDCSRHVQNTYENSCITKGNLTTNISHAQHHLVYIVVFLTIIESCALALGTNAKVL